jgi:hypothetical protein
MKEKRGKFCLGCPSSPSPVDCVVCERIDKFYSEREFDYLNKIINLNGNDLPF